MARSLRGIGFEAARSRRASTESSGCGTAGCGTADDGQKGVGRLSLPRNCSLNVVCFGSPVEIPRSSTNSMAAAVFFFGSKIPASLSRRGSWTLTTAMGSAPLAAAVSVDAPVRAEKSELFPDWGRPTMQIFTFVFPSGD
jgi:hypothetical protein